MMGSETPRAGAKASESSARLRELVGERGGAAEGTIQGYVFGLQDMALKAADARRPVEDQWYEDRLQYLGAYPELESGNPIETIGAGGDAARWRSRATANITRPRTKRLAARMADVLMPTDQPNWALRPSPVPALSDDAQQAVLEDLREQIRAREEAEAAEAAEAGAGEPPPEAGGGVPPEAPPPPVEEALPAPAPLPEPEGTPPGDPAARGGGVMGPRPLPPGVGGGEPMEGELVGEEGEIDRMAEVLGWDAIFQATADEAMRRTDRMQLVMLDQLTGGGYGRAVHRAIKQGCQYGTGVIEGPLLGVDRSVRYESVVAADGEMSLRRREHDIEKPVFDHVPVYDWLPVLTSLTNDRPEAAFRLFRWSRSRLRQAVERDGLWPEAVQRVIDYGPTMTAIYGDFIRSLAAFELGDESLKEDDLYYVFRYTGPADAGELAKVLPTLGGEGDKVLDALGLLGEDGEVDPLADEHVIVYFCENECLLFRPALLDIPDIPYSWWSLDPDETSPWGPSVATMGRSSQHIANASWRLANESGALNGRPMWLIDDSVEPDDGENVITPGKVWRRRTVATGRETPGLEAIQIAAAVEPALIILDRAIAMFEEETGVGPVMPNEVGARESPPGMTLRASGINIEFRDLVRGFDGGITIPTLHRLLQWNLQFGPPEAQGDVEVVALGSSVLLVREVQAGQRMTLLNLAGQNPEVGDVLRIPQITRALVHAMQLSIEDSVRTDEEAEEAREARMRAMAEAVAGEAQSKMELEQARQQGVQAVEQLRAETERERLASQERQTQYKGQIAYQTAQLKTLADERRAAAELALKKRGSTGI